MTIDERIEALAQSLKLMASMRRDAETGWESAEARWETRWTQISTAQQQDGENIRALARIAEIHERRLTHLEGDQS
jgi:hypothetical protein